MPLSPRRMPLYCAGAPTASLTPNNGPLRTPQSKLRARFFTPPPIANLAPPIAKPRFGRSNQVKPKHEITDQTPRCRLGLLTRRLCSTLRLVKPGKTSRPRIPHLTRPRFGPSPAPAVRNICRTKPRNSYSPSGAAYSVGQLSPPPR